MDDQVHSVEESVMSVKTASKPAEKAGKKPSAARAAEPRGRGRAAGPRADGLKPGSKLAKLYDAAVAAGAEGVTEEQLSKKLGWVKCASTLRRVCDRVGASIERKDGRFIVKRAKGAK